MASLAQKSAFTTNVDCPSMGWLYNSPERDSIKMEISNVLADLLSPRRPDNGSARAHFFAAIFRDDSLTIQLTVLYWKDRAFLPTCIRRFLGLPTQILTKSAMEGSATSGGILSSTPDIGESKLLENP
jgi:hypothetical protein